MLFVIVVSPFFQTNCFLRSPPRFTLNQFLVLFSTDLYFRHILRRLYQPGPSIDTSLIALNTVFLFVLYFVLELCIYYVDFYAFVHVNSRILFFYML